MQFGIFTVGDVTPDPTTGRTPTEQIDLMMGRGNTGPVYPWFGRDIRTQSGDRRAGRVLR
jgi:hypothetical protein